MREGSWDRVESVPRAEVGSRRGWVCPRGEAGPPTWVGPWH